MNQGIHPPKIVGVASWIGAVSMAVLFSIAVGFSIKSYFSPISAQVADTSANKYYTSDNKEEGDSVKEQCVKGALVAINNYPGEDTLKSIQADAGKGVNETWLAKMNQISWRCSHVCVEGFETNDYQSAGNKDKIKRLLTERTIKVDGQDKKILVKNTSEILELFNSGKANEISYIINTDSLKSYCEGPNSVDYAAAGTTIGDIKILERNSTNEVTSSADANASAMPAGIYAASTGDDNYLGEGGSASGGTGSKGSTTNGQKNSNASKPANSSSPKTAATGYKAAVEKIKAAKSVSLQVTGNALFSQSEQYIANETFVYAGISKNGVTPLEYQGTNVINQSKSDFSSSNPTYFKIDIGMGKEDAVKLIEQRDGYILYFFGYNTGGTKYGVRNILSSLTVGKLNPSVNSSSDGSKAVIGVYIGKPVLIGTPKKPFNISILKYVPTGFKEVKPVYDDRYGVDKTNAKFKKIFSAKSITYDLKKWNPTPPA